jgi:MerR family transcriptional regulator, light-induced transcriptional regulator
MSMVGTRANGLQQRRGAAGSGRSQLKRSEASVARCPGHPAELHTLARLIEHNIVPRLVEGHSANTGSASQLKAEVEPFTQAILAAGASASRETFASLIAQGHTLDALFEHLLVPAAVHLGSMWDSDALDFLEVTRGMDHIHQILLEHASSFCTDGKTSGPQRRILLVTLPEERHRLGLCLVRANFWREGWDVCCSELEFAADLEALVRATHYDAVGISAGRVGDAATLARNLKRVRKASRNRDLIIIAGGRAFQRDEGLVAAVGVDATAPSGREAVVMLRRLLDSRRAAPA